MTAISREAAAVYATAGPPSQDDRIRELVEGPFDWSRFLWIALRERAVSVAWRRFQRLDLPVPEEQASRLRRHTMVADFTAARLEARLTQTIGSLRSAGVDPVLLKGAALARILFPSFRDRPMGDVDLLVDKDEAAIALEAVRSLAWEVVPENRLIDYTEHHHLPPMEDHTGAGRLEIHTELFYTGHPFGSLSNVLHQRSLSLDAGGRVPDDVHLVLHLCLHFAWSHAMGLGAWRTFHDLSAFVQQGRLDFAKVISEAKTYQAEPYCYWTFRMAHDLAGVPVPVGAMQACRPTRGRWLHRPLQRHFETLLDGPEDRCPSVALKRALWRLAVRPGRSGREVTFPWVADARFLKVQAEADSDRAPAASMTGGRKVSSTVRYLASLVFSKAPP